MSSGFGRYSYYRKPNAREKLVRALVRYGLTIVTGLILSPENIALVDYRGMAPALVIRMDLHSPAMAALEDIRSDRLNPSAQSKADTKFERQVVKTPDH